VCHPLAGVLPPLGSVRLYAAALMLSVSVLVSVVPVCAGSLQCAEQVSQLWQRL